MKPTRHILLFLFTLFIILFTKPDNTLAAISNTRTPIEISTAEELAKIGKDSTYSLEDNYILTADIDLSGRNWEPIGGYYGEKGRVSGNGVFTGTFDGKGHVISGMTINLSGDLPYSYYYAEVGLFGIVGSGNSNDYAEIKNLIFTDVNIKTEFTNGYTAVGTLCGDLNGYASVNNVAVLNGAIYVNTKSTANTVGCGGVIGECRTESSYLANVNKGVTVTNVYNGADVTAGGNDTNHLYSGGIIGRVAKSYCKQISSCVNTGDISYNGDEGFGILAAESENSIYYTNVSNCYTLSPGYGQANGATALTESTLKNGALKTGLSSSVWQAKSGYYPMPSICFNNKISEGIIYLSGINLTYASGESAEHVLTTITLPKTAGNDTLTWKSSNETALAVDGYKATADTMAIVNNTVVTLTASTASGKTRAFKVTVISENVMSASFSRNYAQVGTPLTVNIKNSGNLTFTYTWKVGGKTISNKTNTYTPTSSDLEKFITVKAVSTDKSAAFDLSMYCSELPVVYLDTNDGLAVTSTSNAKDATIRLQGNEEYHDTSGLYSGKTTVKGRGNSTWSFAESYNLKKPYKLKLNKKSNLYNMGTGKNKHWVLLANVIDHTDMRNELLYNFAKDIGMEYSPATVNVVLILNGQYVGLYELCEHVRIGSSRVNVFDWEELGEDIADEVAAVENVNADALGNAMKMDFSWRTSKKFTFKNKTYDLNKYYNMSSIPKFTGGFLMDMDFRIGNTYKYISSFNTDNTIPMFFRNPEYAKTDNEMMTYVKNYLNSYEAALKNEVYYTTDKNTGQTVHYTDLFDLDSLVKYWMVCELSMNWDSMKNSTYLYKDITGKAKMGPAWDYDWAFGNINMYSGTAPFVITGWHSNCDAFCEQSYQYYQWNRYLIKDPYFTLKAYEEYNRIRNTLIEDIIKTGGIIDSSEKKYQKAANADDAKWQSSYNLYSGKAIKADGTVFHTQSQKFNDAVTTLRQFIKQRVAWFDKQFLITSGNTDSSVKNLYKSFGNSTSDKISITGVNTTVNKKTTFTAAVTDSTIKKVAFQIDGTQIQNASVSGNTATLTVDDTMLDSSDSLHIVEAHALDSNGAYMNNQSNFKVFEKVVATPSPTPTATPKPTVSPTAKPTQTPTAAPTDKPTDVPDYTPTATPGDKSTAAPECSPTAAPDGSPTDTPDGTSTATPDITFSPTAHPLGDASVKSQKTIISVKGKSKVKRGKRITLKVKITNPDGNKVKWVLNKKAKKLFKLNKKSGVKVKLTAKNRKGSGKIKVKYGKLTVKKSIKIY